MVVPDYDVIIIGGGAAGLNAALVLGRCRRRVLVCDNGRPRNAVSRGMHNYLTRDGLPPAELLALGRAEVARYGVEFLSVTVTDACCDADGPALVVLEDGRRLTARKLLLATGVTDVLPPIEGIREYYGRSVFHCPYCDGFEMADRPLAVYGQSRDAIGMALSLLTWTNDVVVCTDGGPEPSRHDRRRLSQHGLGWRGEKIARLEGHDGVLERIIFEVGLPLERRGLFFNTGQAQRSPLAQRLGCRFDQKGHVSTDRRGRTGVCNLFLAGDANGDVQFVIVAAGEGASAGVAINRDLQEEDRAAAWREASARRPSRSAATGKPAP